MNIQLLVGVITGLYSIFTFSREVGDCARTSHTKVDNVLLRIWLIGVNDPGFPLMRNSAREQTDILRSRSVTCPCTVVGNKTKCVVHFSQKRYKLSKSLVLLL